MKRLKPIIILLLLCLTGIAQEKKALVLFVQFQDLKFKASYPEFEKFTDSLTLYFNDQFHGNPQFNFVRGPVITLNKNHSEYGNNSPTYNDDHMYLGVIDACAAAADSVNFADYSNGSTSEVRDLLIMVPGKCELDTTARDMFRPQYVEFASRNVYPRFNNRRLICYAIAPELDSTGNFTGIGHMAHEYSHVLGLKDYYDTDKEGSGGISKALWGRLALMDRGNTNNLGHTPPNWCAPDYYTIGAGNGIEIDTAGFYSLEPISRNGTYFIFSGPEEGEVFLAESRVDEGWDAYIGGRGMVIYHFDRSGGDALWRDWDGRNLTAAERWNLNRVNCNPEHQCVELEAPNDETPFFPAGEIESFSSETTPPFRFWDGTLSPLAISGISQAADGTVTFNLSRPISGLRVTPFQTSVILNWKCDESISDIDGCNVICTKDADTLSIHMGVRGEENNWSCLIDELSPSTSYRLTVKIIRSGKPFFSGRISAGTLSTRAGLFPFIYLKGAERNSEGGFKPGSKIPLQAFNTASAAEIRWYFNDTPIEAGTDGLYTLLISGLLKAEIFWEDGSKDILIKEISVR